MAMRAGSEQIELGLGLVSLGRQWGVGKTEPPSEADAAALLQKAVSVGIRVFDTAPAYGASEERLGGFLSSLPLAQRQGLVVMTKAGELWDSERGSAVDHTRDGLCRQIDRSLQLLGRIDVLQIHKATRDVIASADVQAAFEHARANGIAHFGASVSDLEAARLALECGFYDALQFPLNTTSTTFLALLPEMKKRDQVPVINRPFAMGGLVSEGTFAERAQAAFGFLRGQLRNGIVLTGTSKAAHLADNVAAFRAATKSSADRHPLRA
jgi:aryl-alcohol dehydrogenase-like predicted oxidoreductase